jgi:hypothetical protein
MLNFKIYTNNNLSSTHRQFIESFSYIKNIFRLESKDIHGQLRELSDKHSKDNFSWGIRHIDGIIEFGYFPSIEIFKTSNEIAEEYEKYEYENVTVHPVPIDIFVESFLAKS